MMRQREADAMAERARRHTPAPVEQNGALALVAERLRIDATELVDQAALAVEIDRIAVAVLEAIDADCRTAAGLLREITRLAPFQGLGQAPDAVGGAGDLEDQAAQRHQLAAQGRGIALEHCRHRLVAEAFHRWTLARRSWMLWPTKIREDRCFAVPCCPRWARSLPPPRSCGPTTGRTSRSRS